VGPALAAFAHLHGLQSGYVPPISSDDTPTAPPPPLYPAQVQVQPAFQPHPSQQHPGYPQVAQPYVAQPAAQEYPPQPYGYAEQSPAAQHYPFGSPYSGQPNMAQPYPGQQVPGHPVHGQPPAHGNPVPKPYPPQPYTPTPAYGHVPPHGTAQSFGVPGPQYADSTQSLHPQQYGYQPQPDYATPPRLTETISLQPSFTPGYSEQPPRALLRSAEDLGDKKPWHLSDDAPRYLPPGTSEADLDPFGLAALPEQVAYHGPKEVPSEAVYGLLFGLCSLLLFPLAFLGFARARRAGSMIDAAPTRFRGRLVVLLGFALNVTCPILSVAASAYLFGLI
jgi:hypothetical protein